MDYIQNIKIIQQRLSFNALSSRSTFSGHPVSTPQEESKSETETMIMSHYKCTKCCINRYNNNNNETQTLDYPSPNLKDSEYPTKGVSVGTFCFR